MRNLLVLYRLKKGKKYSRWQSLSAVIYNFEKDRITDSLDLSIIEQLLSKKHGVGCLSITVLSWKWMDKPSLLQKVFGKNWWGKKLNRFIEDF